MNCQQTGFRLLVIACTVACLITISLSVPVSAAVVPPDVGGHWSSPEVCRLIVQQVVSVDADGLYRPDQHITRSELVRALVLALGHGADAVALARSPRTFRDVGILHPDGGYLEAAAELGLARGYPGGNFYPDILITRAEVAALIVRAMGFEDMVSTYRRTLPFTDRSSIRPWAYGYIGVAHDCGLVRGYDDDRFHPEAFTTRAEMAIIIARMMERQGTAWSLAGTYRGRSGDALRILPVNSTTPISVVLAEQACLFSNGKAVTISSIDRGDQVFLVVDDQGKTTYLHALWSDEIGTCTSWTTNPNTVTISLHTGAVKTVGMNADAVVFRHGRPARITDIEPGDRIYVVYDVFSGMARMIDAVRVDAVGIAQSVDVVGRMVSIIIESSEVKYVISDDAIIAINGNSASLANIMSGDDITAITVDMNRIVYLEVRRGV